ncbi:MAG: STAS domain-containing protein [Gammaproteobacteria bacterium]|nr:STAS domain-containing protein [Gammaproteobacteria bacterium]
MRENNAASWSLAGPMTLETAAGLRVEGDDWLQAEAGAVRTLDLGKVTAVDSAAIALLLEWQRLARQRSLQLDVVNAPDRIRKIASISDLEAMIGLA